MTNAAVQYVTTSDGYKIAYAIQGEGPLLVCLPLAFSHAQQVWTQSSFSPLLQELASRFRVVYYDGRGQGLSQRSLPASLTVDSFLADLDAVLDALHERRVTLFADNFWTHIALRLAARQPERVRALVLMHCATSFTDQASWFARLAEQNWDYYLDTQVGAVQPGTETLTSAARDARKERLKQRTTQTDWINTLNAFADSNATSLLPGVSCPALVLHASNQSWVSQESATATAALIPNSRLVSISGAGFWGDPQQAAAAIESFLSTAAIAQAPADSATARGLRDLSTRQVEVLRLVAKGKTNREIAGELTLSPRTVERHVNDIYARLGVRNRAEAVAIALNNF